MVCRINKSSDNSFEYTYLFKINALFQNNTYWSYDYNLYSIVYNNSQIAVYDYQGVFLGVLNENTPGVEIIKEGSREFEQDSILYCKPEQLFNAGLKPGVIEWSLVALDGYKINSFGMFRDLLSGKVYLATEEEMIDGCNNIVYVLYVELKNIIPTTIIGLFDYSFNVDLRDVETIKYYFLNYPTVFNAFPIIDTGSGIPNTLNALDTYYQKGYRTFLLTSLSTVIAGVLEWFNSHPDTVGISNYSQANALSIPKKIYRLTPDNNLKFDLYSNQCILPFDIIYFIYDPNELINQSQLLEIEEIIKNTGKTLVLFPIEDPSTLTTETVNEIMSQIIIGNNSSILVSMVTYTNKFYNLFNDTTPYTNYPFYEQFINPSIVNPFSQSYFENKLYTITGSQANLSTSYLWDQGLKSFGIENYSSSALNSLNMAYQLEKNKLVNDLGQHSDSIVFNQVTRDVVNVNIGIFLFTKTNEIYEFIPQSIYYKNEKNLTYFSSVDLSTKKPVNPNFPQINVSGTNNIVALLDSNGDDSIIVKTIYYLWTSTNDVFPVFPIYDTRGSLELTLSYLEKYYNLGYRVFLGFSISTIFKEVLTWFDNHPDAVGLSLASSANSLQIINKPIYRLQPVDSFTLSSIKPIIYPKVLNGGKVFYIYTLDQLACIEALDIINNTYGEENVFTYPLKPDFSNLTQEDLIDYFSKFDLTDNDSIINYIIYTGEFDARQKYVSLFDKNLILPCIQFDILATGFPVIDLSTTSLNNLYKNIQIESITTSKIYNDASKYLGDDFFPETINGLYLLNALSTNYNIDYLYSYSSILGFNEYNDVSYGSVGIYTYKDGVFEQGTIFSNDPLYGELVFDLIK